MRPGIERTARGLRQAAQKDRGEDTPCLFVEAAHQSWLGWVGLLWAADADRGIFGSRHDSGDRDLFILSCSDGRRRVADLRKKNAGMLVWIGARNQNHFELKRIAKILAEGPNSLLFMFKNQVWLDKKHWFGIYEHIAQTGFPQHRLLACHRGFSPGYGANPDKLRNIPEYKLCMEMKEKMKIPMILDPSHIAGARDKVFTIVEQSRAYDFDGYIIEVHDNVSIAKTDATVEQLGEVMDMIARSEAAKLAA